MRASISLLLFIFSFAALGGSYSQTAPPEAGQETKVQEVKVQGAESKEKSPSGLSLQLKTGEKDYFLLCAMCHGDKLEGHGSTPALIGLDFTSIYNQVNLSNLTELIQEEMPLDTPGTLSEKEVLDITAYILKQNGATLPEEGLGSEHLEMPMQIEPLKPEGQPEPKK